MRRSMLKITLGWVAIVSATGGAAFAQGGGNGQGGSGGGNGGGGATSGSSGPSCGFAAGQVSAAGFASVSAVLGLLLWRRRRASR